MGGRPMANRKERLRLYQLCDDYESACDKYARGEVDQLCPPEAYWAAAEVKPTDEIMGDCQSFFDEARDHPILTAPTGVHPRSLVLRRRVGSGAGGLVWEASHGGVPVAVKILKLPAALHHDTELKALQRVHHPNVIRLLHFGNIVGPHRHPELNLPAGEFNYLVLEWAAGNSLKNIVPVKPPDGVPDGSAPLDERRLLELMEQLTWAVSRLHEYGVFHRDLKPSNILLSEGGSVKVADFGIASVLTEGRAEAVTKTGEHLGTYGYQAPEIANGTPAGYGKWSNERRADFWTRVDVYGIGAVLYALVMGEAPNEHGHPNWNEWPGTSRQLKGLRRVCERCLVSDPQGRYKSVAAVRAAFQRVRVPHRGFVLAVLGILAVAVLLCYAILSSIGQGTVGKDELAGKPTEPGRTSVGDVAVRSPSEMQLPPGNSVRNIEPQPIPRIDRIEFRYHVVKGVKNAGANLVGRLYSPTGVVITKADLSTEDVKEKRKEPFRSVGATVPGQITLADLKSQNYSVDVSHEAGGINHHVALRFSVEARTSDGVWHTVLKADDLNHTFNPYPGELEDGKPAKYYDLEDNPRRNPPSSQTTRRVTLKPSE